MKRLKINLSLLALLSGFALQAQEVLSLSDAIGLALENNPNIRVAINTQEQAANRATPGQAGLLPNLSANGSYSTGESDTKIEVANQPNPIETNGAGSTNMAASVNLDYTLFSGLANKRTYTKLKITADLREASTRMEIENVVLQVASAYYNVARSYTNKRALEESVAASKDRLERSKARRELSGGTQLNELNAQVDYNKDKVALMDAEKAYLDALDQLYLLVNKGEPTAGQPDTLVADLPNQQNLGVLKQELLEQNAQMLSARFSEQSSMLDYKITKSAYYPQLKLNGAYAYSRNESEGSFLLSNETLGYTAGLTLSIPLYQGGKRNIQTKNAKLQYQSAQLTAQQTEWSLMTDLKAAFRDYQNSLAVFELEKSNKETARLNFEYSQQKYQQGLLTGLQFREAQINLLLANNSLNNVQYNARLAELELLRLSGGILGQYKEE